MKGIMEAGRTRDTASINNVKYRREAYRRYLLDDCGKRVLKMMERHGKTRCGLGWLKARLKVPLPILKSSLTSLATQGLIIVTVIERPSGEWDEPVKDLVITLMEADGDGRQNA